MSKKFIAFYEGLVLSGIDLGIQTTSLVLNKLSVCELRGHVLFLPTKVASSLMLKLFPSLKFKEREENAEMISYTIIFFLNRGQSKVNVSYSPPSPQTWTPYFLESWK